MRGTKRTLRRVGLAAGLLLAAAPGLHADTRVIKVAVAAGAVPAELQTIRVPQGTDVTLRWESDGPLDVHLHGYDLRATIEPGAVAEMRFLAHATGRFSVEAHVEGGHRRILYIEVHPE